MGSAGQLEVSSFTAYSGCERFLSGPPVSRRYTTHASLPTGEVASAGAPACAFAGTSTTRGAPTSESDVQAGAPPPPAPAPPAPPDAALLPAVPPPASAPGPQPAVTAPAMATTAMSHDPPRDDMTPSFESRRRRE